MSRRKTLSEIDEQLKTAKKRVKKLEEQAREATKAEKAAQDKAVLDAVRRWWQERNATLPKEKQTAWKDVPALFDGWTDKHRAKVAEAAKQKEQTLAGGARPEWTQ